MSVSDGPASKSPKPLSVSRPRLLQLVGTALVLVLLFVLLPRSFAQIVFVILIVALIVYALQSSLVRSQLRHLPQDTAQSIISVPGQIGPPVMTNVRGAWNSWRAWLIREDTRADLASSILLFAIVLAVSSALAFRPAVPYERLGIAAMLMIAAIATLGLGLRLSREVVTLPFPTSVAFHPQHARILLVGLGAALLLAVAEINGNALQSSDVREVTIHVQFLLFVGGCLAVMWGLAGSLLPTFSLREHWREVLVVLGLTLLAMFLRMWHLDTAVRYPIHEHFYTYFINTMTDAQFKQSLFIPALASTPAPQVYTYTQWLIFNLFGQTWFGFRATSAILGTLMIPTLYLLVRSLFDRKIAIAAALLLATFPQHIHMSRLALANTAEPIFGLLALAFLARALRTNHRADYVIAGVSLGLTQYFVDEGRVFFPALVGLWLGIGILVWRPRPSWRGMLLLLIAAVIVGLPYYYTQSAQGLPFFPRGNEVGLSYWIQRYSAVPFDQFLNELSLNINGSVLHFVHSPDQAMAWIFYGGSQPLILTVFVPLFILGIGYGIWRSRWPGGLLLILWIAGAAIGIGLVQFPGASVRFTVVTPAIALAMALGVIGVLQLAHMKGLVLPQQGRIAQFSQRYTGAATAVLIGLIAVGQVAYYFGDHLPNFNIQIHQTGFTACGSSNTAMLRSTDFPPRTRVFLISLARQCDWTVDGNVLKMFRGDMTLLTPWHDEVTDAYLLREIDRRVDNAVYVWPDDQATIDMLHRYFRVDDPQFDLTEEAPPGVNFVLYYIPAEPQFGPMRLVDR